MIKKNKSLIRIKSDFAGGVTIFALTVFVVILAVSIFFIDVSKNSYLTSNYFQMTQRAAQNGLKDQNSIGGLTPKAAESVVREYLAERNADQKLANGSYANTVETGAFRRMCQSKYPTLPKITVEFSTQRNNKGQKFSSTFVYENGQWTPPITGDYPAFYRQSYRTIKVNVEDFGDNYFFSIFGRPCEKFNIESSAIAIDADAGDTGK